jgi:hypothetical protein
MPTNSIRSMGTIGDFQAKKSGRKIGLTICKK